MEMIFDIFVGKEREIKFLALKYLIINHCDEEKCYKWSMKNLNFTFGRCIDLLLTLLMNVLAYQLIDWLMMMKNSERRLFEYFVGRTILFLCFFCKNFPHAFNGFSFKLATAAMK